MRTIGLLLAALAACSAYSLGAARPRTRVLTMSLEQLAKNDGLDYERFRYGIGNADPRPTGGDASTAISTGSARFVRDQRGIYSPPAAEMRPTSRTFAPHSGDNTIERRSSLSRHNY